MITDKSATSLTKVVKTTRLAVEASAKEDQMAEEESKLDMWDARKKTRKAQEIVR
jgi:hypothetical protein